MIGTTISEEGNDAALNVDGPRFALQGAVDAKAVFEQTIRLKFKRPGHYRVRIDLVSERICWFQQLGSKALELDIHVTAE